MSVGELLLILIVALIVFGPKRLPMLAHHLGKWVSHLSHYKQKATVFWQQQQHEQTLQDNIKKAKDAETRYLQDGEL